MKSIFRSRIRPIILTMVAPIAGFTFIFFLGFLLNFEFSKQVRSIVNLGVVALIAFLVFPRWLGIPFGRIETRDFLRKVGFFLPETAWKHIVLGLIFAGCTTSGMLIASTLTGRYVVDLSTLNLPHLLFSLNPALWEELFYRGVLMILLLRNNLKLKSAFLIQSVLFGVMHVKGTDLFSSVDVFSVMVMAIGFTYLAYKTRCLVAGIVFHYFHDAFLFFVQPPGGVYVGITENAFFYGSLWLTVGLGCIVTKYLVEKIGVYTTEELYTMRAQTY